MWKFQLNDQVKALQSDDKANGAKCDELMKEVEDCRKQLLESEKQHEKVGFSSFL